MHSGGRSRPLSVRIGLAIWSEACEGHVVTTRKRLRDFTIATCACGCHVSACQHYWYDQKVKCNDCSYLWATRVHWCGRPGEIVAGRVLMRTGLYWRGESAVLVLEVRVGRREVARPPAAPSGCRVVCLACAHGCVWWFAWASAGLPPPGQMHYKCVGPARTESPCECHVYLRRAWCVSGGVSLLPLLCLFLFCCT